MGRISYFFTLRSPFSRRPQQQFTTIHNHSGLYRDSHTLSSSLQYPYYRSTTAEATGAALFKQICHYFSLRSSATVGFPHTHANTFLLTSAGISFQGSITLPLHLHYPYYRSTAAEATEEPILSEFTGCESPELRESHHRYLHPSTQDR